MLHHLAQVNIAKPLAPLDSPQLSEFIAALEPINKLAEQSPGFLWRLQDESGNATQIKVFEDPFLIINMSLWESPEALFDYVYKSAHAKFMARRKEWFAKLAAPYMVLWWVPRGCLPTPQEAAQRLQILRQSGPTSAAFTFKQRFPAPEKSLV